MFNKKKIKELEKDNVKIFEILRSLDGHIQIIKKAIPYHKAGDSIPEDSALFHIWKTLNAIKEYLKLEIYCDWENDPNYLPPEPIKRKVWKARKQKP